MVESTGAIQPNSALNDLPGLDVFHAALLPLAIVPVVEACKNLVLWDPIAVGEAAQGYFKACCGSRGDRVKKIVQRECATRGRATRNSHGLNENISRHRFYAEPPSWGIASSSGGGVRGYNPRRVNGKHFASASSGFRVHQPRVSWVQ